MSEGGSIFFRGAKPVQDRAAQSSGGGGLYFKLEDKESAEVHFLTKLEDLLSFFDHRVSIGDGKTKNFTCVANERKCILCENGVDKRFVTAALIYNLTLGKVQVIKLGIRFWQQVEDMATTYGSLNDRPYKVSRKGVMLNTVWSAVALDKKDPPEISGGADIPVLENLFASSTDEDMASAIQGLDSSEEGDVGRSPY